MLLYLRKIDVFGADVGLKYEGQNKYTSKTGGVASFIIGGLLLALLYQQCSQIYSRSSPNVIYQQKYVDNPTRYNLSPNKFTLMVALLNENDTAIIDNTIYNIEAEFEFKEQVNQNNSTTYNFVNVPIALGPCTIDDFAMTQVESYFLAQDYQNMYCIKNQSSLYLEGQFDKNQFAQVRLFMYECVDQPNCKSPEIRQQFIKTSMVQIYYTNRILELQNYEQPFMAVGKTQYYDIFYDYLLQTDFIFQNTHVIDDSGLIMATADQTTDLVFVEDRYQLSAKTNNQFYECSIYLDKDKEDAYYRSYKKIPEVLSQLGGTFQVLFFIGCLFIKPYNSIKLKKRLYKDIFSEQNEEENNQDKNTHKNKLKKKNPHNSSHKIIDPISSVNFKNRTTTIQLNNDEIQTNNSSKERKLTIYERFKDAIFFDQANEMVKQQYIQLQSFRSLKTIINTEIQFNLLKKLFYQSDLSPSKIHNSPTQILDSYKQNFKSHQELFQNKDTTILNSLHSPNLIKQLNPCSRSYLTNIDQSIKQEKPILQLNSSNAMEELIDNNNKSDVHQKSHKEQSNNDEQCTFSQFQDNQKFPFSPSNNHSFRKRQEENKRNKEELCSSDQEVEINEPPIRYDIENYIHSVNTINTIKKHYSLIHKQKQKIKVQDNNDYHNTQ